jgi:hypothetical protein
VKDLDAYLTGEHADPDAFEDAMFAAPDDPDLAFFDRIARHGARLVEHKTYDMGCSPEDVDALIAKGHRIQIDEHWPGARATVTLDPDAEMLCTKLHIGRTDLERVDVEIEVLAHHVSKTIRDALVDQRRGMLCGLCERPLAEIAFTAGPTRVKVRERGGERRVIAEYNFNGA